MSHASRSRGSSGVRWRLSGTPRRYVPDSKQPPVITVRNRQRLLKVNARRLKTIAARALALAAPSPVGAASPPRPERQLAAGTPLPPLAPQHFNIVLVDDAQIAVLNRQFHHTDGPTDILTFDYGDSAELIISVETAIRQAGRFGSTLARELALYVVHGILHLHGYDDHTPRQRARMRAAERRISAVVGRPRPAFALKAFGASAEKA